VYHSTLGWRGIKKKYTAQAGGAAGVVDVLTRERPVAGSRKVDVRLPGKGNSNSHGARPVHLIITMIKWIRTRRLSIKNYLSAQAGGAAGVVYVPAREREGPKRTVSRARGTPRGFAPSCSRDSLIVKQLKRFIAQEIH